MFLKCQFQEKILQPKFSTHLFSDYSQDTYLENDIIHTKTVAEYNVKFI